jgi:hypothetical protein
MLYFATGIPLTLMGAESDDGIHWRPMNRPDIKVTGEKYAPNHLFSSAAIPFARDARKEYKTLDRM